MSRKILAIYGIQDINSRFPQMIHDHNLALISGSKVEKYLQLERLTGFKYDNRLNKYLYAILKQEKLLGKDLILVYVDSVLGRSFISEQGNIRFEADPFAQLSTQNEKAVGFWLDKQVDAYVVSHEKAHIFSVLPFYGMFKPKSLIIHFDGGASKSNVSVWFWNGQKLELLHYSWDLKYLSSLYNANALNFFILNIKPQFQNSLPGKYMGFSGWGRPQKHILEWLKENDFFQDIWTDKKRFFTSAKERFGWNKDFFDLHDPFIQDIAATVQDYFTREFLKFVRNWQQKTKANYLYYTGGSALNLYTNTALVDSQMFEQVFIPPCPGDSGLSVGAGAYVNWQVFGRYMDKHSPYLCNWQLEGPEVVDFSDDIEQIAQMLLDKKILAIYNGFSEIGPRALGNRSIIALPNDKGLSKTISMHMKGREWYRPLAPIMLYFSAQEVTGRKHIPVLARYMLMNFKILPHYYDRLRGVVHADGTSRIQVLFEREDNPFMWDLLMFMKKKYGVLALINTSFNSKGRPIVHTLEQAQEQANQMQLDGLVIQGKLHRLK